VRELRASSRAFSAAVSLLPEPETPLTPEAVAVYSPLLDETLPEKCCPLTLTEKEVDEVSSETWLALSPPPPPPDPPLLDEELLELELVLLELVSLELDVLEADPLDAELPVVALAEPEASLVPELLEDEVVAPALKTCMPDPEPDPEPVSELVLLFASKLVELVDELAVPAAALVADA